MRGPSGVARPLSEASLARGSAHGDPDQPGETALLTVDHTVGAQRGDLVVLHPAASRTSSVSAPAHDGDRPVSSPGVREPGDHGEFGVVDEGAAVEMVAVHTGLVEGQHRCHTAVGGLEDGCPLVAGSGCEHGSDPFAEFRPALPVVLRRQVGVGEAQMFEETSVEMPLDRGDRQVLAISALVDGVEGAPPSKRLVPRSGRWKPLAAIPKKVDAIDATPSVMATSTTWPSPERFASHRAHMTP